MRGCYCDGGSAPPIEARIVQPLALPSAPIRRGLAVSLVVHVVVGLVGYATVEPAKRVELVDIDVAPPPPPVEALPAEKKQRPEEQLAQQARDQADRQTALDEQPPRGEGAIADAGVDAPVDAAPADAAPLDARPRRRPDAGLDAGLDATTSDEPLIADHDAGVTDDGGTTVAIVGDGGAPPPTDGGEDIAGTGEGSGSGSGGALGDAQGSGSGKPGVEDAVAVEGAPTSAGTAANLLAYFPKGHRVTVLVRFDRLRGTEWIDPTERLFQPMPDYRRLFGGANAKIGQKLDMLVISSTEPDNILATTLVARTRLDRAALRTFLESGGGTVLWSTVKGGLVGKRGGANLYPGDKRVFLSPFRGWFLLAHPFDLPNLLAPTPGNLDAIEASVKLPPWLQGIRKIEEESGKEARGPALVMTMDLGGKRISLANDFGLGVKSFPMPQRITVAAEVVKQGWIVQGNLRFTTPADAAEFVKTALSVKQRIADSTALQLAVGKPVARIVANLSFATGGERVSYSTSVSISDMQALMAVAAQLLDVRFAGK